MRTAHMDIDTVITITPNAERSTQNANLADHNLSSNYSDIQQLLPSPRTLFPRYRHRFQT